MSDYIGLDFETYAEVNLPKHGLDRYVKCPHFQPLIAHTYTVDSEGGVQREVFDFVADMDAARRGLWSYLVESDKSYAAHNAPFEQAVLRWLGIPFKPADWTDTAVVSRMWGAGGKLEAAAPQLLGVDKMAEGWDLIKLFSIPGKFQEANGSGAFDPDIITAHPNEWATYNEYCGVDAELSHNLAEFGSAMMTLREYANTEITEEMNLRGWPVDLAAVHSMKRRYEENLAATLEKFYNTYQLDVEEKKRLNFNSFPQQKAWCAERGVKARSFDELHVKKMVVAIDKKLLTMMPPDKRDNYEAVQDFLRVKQELGGSSLSKLDTLINMTSEDGRLRDQYLHVGAGQTWRASGRGVQLQNLKRLTDELLDMDSLEEEEVEIDSTVLASNIRQCFTASQPDGFLIVGDFASVESRGLAWLVNATWKLDAFRAGKDMYKVLAAQMFNINYNNVLKPQRQTGKVGELSCGYGAGPEAVKDFAEKMGTVFTLQEATRLVSDWRKVNPEIVDFWSKLDEMLHELIVKGKQPSALPVGSKGFFVNLRLAVTPDSLTKQHPGAMSFEIILRQGTTTHVRRMFHGAYVRGNNIGYYKPSERKTGDLWKNSYMHPKTKQRTFYTVYGGKLTGILTQSLCREMFYNSLRLAKQQYDTVWNAELIGQFHDEAVVDWVPNDGLHLAESVSLERAKRILEVAMSSPGPFTGFPLAAEIKHDYRYTK